MVGNGPLNLAHLRGAQNGVLARLSSEMGSISEEQKSTMGPNLGGKQIHYGAQSRRKQSCQATPQYGEDI
jgi:hypothetical protein